MALRVQDARDWVGVADGAAITVANSVQVGSTPFHEVLAQSGSSLSFDVDEPAFVVVGVSGGVARLGWTDLGASDEFTARMEAVGASGLSGTARVVDLRTAADGNVARLELDASNRRLALYAGSTQVAFSGSSEQVPTSAGWRVELTGKVSTGQLRAALFTASDGKGASPLWDTGLMTDQPLGSTGVSWARFGKLNTSQAASYAVRNLAADTVLGLLGPLVLHRPTGLSWTGSQLSWSAVPGATSYEVERDGVVVATGVTGTSWTDSAVAAGVARRYRVRAVA